MKVLIRNTNYSMMISLTSLRIVGFWSSQDLTRNEKLLNNLYGCFVFMFLLGTYLITQIVDLYIIWGDLPLMTGTAFVLFTNIAQAVKIVNLLVKKELVKKIISEADGVLKRQKDGEGMKIVRRCNIEMLSLQIVYFALTLITTTGWASSPEKGMLPLRAWYPYDTSKSPAYELTYGHQVGAIIVAALLNVCKDTLVSTLVAQCRCRLQLLGMTLENICQGLQLFDEQVYTPEQEKIARDRLKSCIEEHQAALEAASTIESCFSLPTFLQFFVSLIIICVTAFQLVSQSGNLVRLLSMGTYLLNMMFQVFIYCYQGHHLSEESSEVSTYAYQCPWYACSTKLRKSILIVMTRSRRMAKITAGGFTTLSLASFMAIIKASYSLFTLLQQVDEKN